jgi:hypothetical protein
MAFSVASNVYNGSAGYGGTQVRYSGADFFESLDRNHDGVLTRGELDAALAYQTASPHQSVRVSAAPLPEDPSSLPEAGLFQPPTVMMPTSSVQPGFEVKSPLGQPRSLAVSGLQAESFVLQTSARGSSTGGSARMSPGGVGGVVVQQTFSPANSYVAPSIRVGDTERMMAAQTASLSSSHKSLPQPGQVDIGGRAATRVPGQVMQARVSARSSSGSPQQEQQQLMMQMQQQQQQQVMMQQVVSTSASQNLFDALDRNHDGTITRNEFNAALRSSRR